MGFNRFTSTNTNNRFLLIVLSAFLLMAFDSQAQFFDQKKVNIYFEVNQDVVTAEYKQKIREAILEIGTAPIHEIYVEGYADQDASDEYNIQLSDRRAENTRQFLQEQGVKDRMINKEYFGETKPSGLDKSEDRRVQITFVYEALKDKDTTTNIKTLIVTTFKAGTKERLPCNFTLEVNGQNFYGRTDSKAVCVLQSVKYKSEITFNREGYLNEVLILSDAAKKIRNDTAFVEVHLRPVMVLQKLRFEHIFFYTDSDQLKPESKPELSGLLLMLQQNKDLYVEIQGHMNFAISRHATPAHKKYNLDLSHNRAKAVYNYLVANGIEKNRLTYKGLSNFQMIYPDPQSKAQEDMNKRVEVWTLQILAEK